MKSTHTAQPAGEPYLRTSAVMAYVGGVGRTTLFVWRRDRGFPKPIEVSARVKLYKRSEVDAWLARQGLAAA